LGISLYCDRKTKQGSTLHASTDWSGPNKGRRFCFLLIVCLFPIAHPTKSKTRYNKVLTSYYLTHQLQLVTLVHHITTILPQHIIVVVGRGGKTPLLSKMKIPNQNTDRTKSAIFNLLLLVNFFTIN
jgi:hypothetical protein